MSSKNDNASSTSCVSTWIEKESRSNPGKFYYFNKTTRQCQWQKPEGRGIVIEAYAAIPLDKPQKKKKRKHPGGAGSDNVEKVVEPPQKLKKIEPTPQSSSRSAVHETAPSQQQKSSINKESSSRTKALNNVAVTNTQNFQKQKAEEKQLVVRDACKKVQKRKKNKKRPSTTSGNTITSKDNSSTTILPPNGQNIVSINSSLVASNISKASDSNLKICYSNVVKSNINEAHSAGKSLITTKQLNNFSRNSHHSLLKTSHSGANCAQGRLLNLQRKLLTQQSVISKPPEQTYLQVATEATILKPLQQKLTNRDFHEIRGDQSLKESIYRSAYSSQKESINKTAYSSPRDSIKKTAYSNLKESINSSSNSCLKKYQNSQKINNFSDNFKKQENLIGGLAAKRLAKLQSKLVSEHESICEPECINSTDEAMEVDIESQIGELRQNCFINQEICFMDIEFDYPSSPVTAFFVVLDTNVLLSDFQFIVGLRDSVVQGKGPVHLYLPWQVLQELDSLKDRGKSKIQRLARQAINYLHDNLSSKHPRVQGQTFKAASQSSFSCPDDNILQACIQLVEQGLDVILLSNDINLCNKALVCNVNAVSKDGFIEKFQNTKDIQGTLQCENLKSAESFNDVIICEMKEILKETLSKVVSEGMENQYKSLWKKRTLITPPWDGPEPVLRCLGHHLLPIYGDTFSPNIKESIDQLIEFLRGKTKKYGVDTSIVIGGLELALKVLENIPLKYENLVKNGILEIQKLKMKLRNSASRGVCVPENVLKCFDDALKAASSLCLPQSLSDPDWKGKAEPMLVAVQSVIHLMTKLLLKPLESLQEEDNDVKALVDLIKGVHSITPNDIIEFFKQEHYRTLVRNGIDQFSDSAKQLTTGIMALS